MRKRTIVMSSAVAIVLGTGVAYASIPGPDGTIYGCYKNGGLGDGALYVIDSSASCPTGYTSLNWDQTSPSGISGYQVVTESITISGPKGAGQVTRDILCPAGKVALGASGRPDVIESQPKTDGTGWEFTISYPSISDGSSYVSTNRLTCATLGV